MKVEVWKRTTCVAERIDGTEPDQSVTVDVREAGKGKHRREGVVGPIPNGAPEIRIPNLLQHT